MPAEVTEQPKKTSLKANIGWFGIGTFFAKILSFFIAPAYSYYLSTAEFGVADIINTAFSLLLPLVTLAIQEAVIRFNLDKAEDSKKTFSIGLITTLIGCALMTGLVLVASRFIYQDLWLSVLLSYIAQALFLFFQSFAKSIKRAGVYAISSVIYSAFTVGATMGLLAGAGLQINAYFYGIAVGALAGTLSLFFVLKVWNYFSFKSIDFALFKSMVRYSAPLIIANVSYWIISGADKYITNALMGDHYNGLLSVVHRIPSLCVILYTVFYSAYLLSALSDHKLEEATRDEDVRFYNDVFTKMTSVLFVAIAGVALIAYPIVLLYSSGYIDSWPYIALYTFGATLGGFRGFFSIFYMLQKKTGRLTLVVLGGALINAVSCFLLMKFTDLGLWATAISTVLANGFIAVFFMADSHKFIQIRYSWQMGVSLALCAFAGVAPAIPVSLPWFFVITGAIFIAVVVLNLKPLIALSKDILPKKKPVEGETHE